MRLVEIEKTRKASSHVTGPNLHRYFSLKARTLIYYGDINNNRVCKLQKHVCQLLEPLNNFIAFKNGNQFFLHFGAVISTRNVRVYVASFFQKVDINLDMAGRVFKSTCL